MQAPVTHILALTTLRRARMLPTAGKVLVKNGQKVNGTDVIGESPALDRHVILDVRQTLRISNPSRVNEVIERRVGERVEKDDVLAQTGGLFNRVLRSPQAGVVLAITGGSIVIQAAADPVQTRAGLAGTITEVFAERGAIVESTGALIQGMWGNGGVDAGVLLSLARTPDDVLTRDRLDVSMRGAVVLGGILTQVDVLKAAAELPLRGLILGSAPSDLIPAMQSAPFPVILVNGFGRIPMDSAAYKILTTNEKRDTALNANPWNTFTGDRPEVLIPLPASAPLPPESDTFKSGQAVRVQGSSYGGQVGTLIEILPGLTRLPSGVRAEAAVVGLENEQVTLPLANLDVLE
jgi:hypothetical protein